MLLSWNVLTIASASFDTFTPDSSPYGIPYTEWLEKWVTWWTSIPIDKHPYIAPSDPKKCSIMQDGPVWFLPDITPRPGKTLDYKCNIPLGKSILIPVSITFCEKDNKGTCGHSLTDKELLELADNIRTPIEQMVVEINGIKIPLNGPPIKTDFFNIIVPDPPPREIWAELKTGTHKTTASAYFLIVHDMPAGKYMIKLKVLDLLKGNEGPPPRFEPIRSGSYEILIQ